MFGSPRIDKSERKPEELFRLLEQARTDIDEWTQSCREEMEIYEFYPHAIAVEIPLETTSRVKELGDNFYNEKHIEETKLFIRKWLLDKGSIEGQDYKVRITSSGVAAVREYRFRDKSIAMLFKLSFSR